MWPRAPRVHSPDPNPASPSLPPCPHCAGASPEAASPTPLAASAFAQFSRLLLFELNHSVCQKGVFLSRRTGYFPPWSRWSQRPGLQCGVAGRWHLSSPSRPQSLQRLGSTLSQEGTCPQLRAAPWLPRAAPSMKKNCQRPTAHLGDKERKQQRTLTARVIR